MGVRFFPVGDDLEPEPGWADPIEAGDLVVLIAYFGWRPSNTTIAEAQARRAMVLEDASQALLTHSAGAGADFVLFSPRKTVAVPDGGILSGSLSGLTPLPLEPPPESWLHKAVEARRQRGQYDAYGGDRTWFTLYQDAEEHAPVGPYAMSPLTARLLSTAFDYDDVADRRRANYLALLQHLRSLAVRPELPPGVVPLGFPIRVEDRAALLNHLYAQQIYPPVHWPISGIVPEAFEASHRLSGEILTLPCDQRYGDQEMLRVVQHVLEAQAR